jgi:hypothetical protein
MIIFINNLGCLQLYVANIHIGLHYNKPRLSPNAFTNGEFILDDMLILATTPMYRQFPVYILLNFDNCPYDFASTPQTLHQLYIDNGMGGIGTSNHYAFGSFGSYDINIGQAHEALGHVIVHIMEIPWGTRRPPNNSSAWWMFQREDALIGEGGSVVTRTTRAANHGGINGPTRAQEEVLGTPTTYPKKATRLGEVAAATAVIRLTRAPDP